MELGLVTAIRPMESTDLDRVLEIEAATYSQPWSADVFDDELAADHRTYLVAELDGSILGYGGLMVVGQDAHVTTLVAAKSSPVKAIGSRVMLRLIDAGLGSGATQLTLEVRSSNRRAQDFYRRFGLAPVGVRKNYYRDEDALIMWAHDIGGPHYQARLREIEESLP